MTAEEGTFAGLIQRALNVATTPEKMAEKAFVHVEKVVDRAIEEALTWGDTAKTIKEAVKASLRVNELNIPSFAHVLAQIIERQIHARTAEVVAGKLAEDINSLLNLAPKEVKLSTLIAELLEGDIGDLTEVGLSIEWDDDSSFVWMYINKGGAPDSNWEADIRLLVSLGKKCGEYETDGCGFVDAPKATISQGHVSGSDLKKDVRFGYGTEHKNQRTKFGAWFGFEQKVLAMYAVGTVIELDEDSCVLSRYDY